MSGNDGQSFEAFLEGYHADLAKRGLAHVTKLHTPGKVVGPPNHQGVVPYRLGKKITCDWGGTLAPRGTAVWFESKDWESAERVACSEFDEGQTRFLETMGALGAVTFVIIRGPGGIVHYMPPSACWQGPNGLKSWRWDALPVVPEGKWLDFLAGQTGPTWSVSEALLLDEMQARREYGRRTGDWTLAGWQKAEAEIIERAARADAAIRGEG